MGFLMIFPLAIFATVLAAFTSEGRPHVETARFAMRQRRHQANDESSRSTSSQSDSSSIESAERRKRWADDADWSVDEMPAQDLFLEANTRDLLVLARAKRDFDVDNLKKAWCATPHWAGKAACWAHCRSTGHGRGDCRGGVFGAFGGRCECS